MLDQKALCGMMLTENSENAIRSYEEARTSCESKVDAIMKECRRLNVKYNDPAFHLADYDTLASLAPGDNPDSVDSKTYEFTGSVKRIEVSGNRTEGSRRMCC